MGICWLYEVLEDAVSSELSWAGDTQRAIFTLKLLVVSKHLGCDEQTGNIVTSLCLNNEASQTLLSDKPTVEVLTYIL